MLECRYKLNIDGFVKEFNSDKELTEFIKNRVDKKEAKFSKDNLDYHQNKAYTIFFNDVYNKSLSEPDIARINDKLKVISDSVGDVPWHLQKSKNDNWYVAGYKNGAVTSENYYSPYANGKYTGQKYAIKFSLSDDQAAIEKEIDSMPKSELSGHTEKVGGKNVDISSEYYFLHTPHTINGNEQLLSTLFDAENYENNFIKDVRQNPNKYSKSLIDFTDEQLKSYVKTELEKDNSMLSISAKMSGIVTLISNGKQFHQTYEAITELLDLINKYNKEQVVYKDSDKQEIFNKVKTFVDSIENFGKMRGGLKIMTPDKSVCSNVNIFSNNGTPTLFKIAVSRKPYDLWDSAKKLDANYSLALKRQILDYYTDMSNSNLMLAPIILPETNNKLDINSLTFGSIVNSGMEDSMSYTNGAIKQKLDQILPPVAKKSQIINTDKEELNHKVLDALFQNYNFKSQRKITDIENLYNKCLDASKNSDTVFISDALNGGAHIEEKKTSPGWEERFRKKVEEYVTRYNDASSNRLYNLTKLVDTSKKLGADHVTTPGKWDSTKINLIFKKYLSEDWKMTSYPELLDVGIVVFQNYKDGLLEAVSVTGNDLDFIYNLGMGKTVLGKFATDDMVKNDTLVMKSTGANIELMKTLAILNNIPEIFSGGLKLSSIVVYDQVKNTSNFANIDLALYNFNQLLARSREKFKNNFQDGRIVLADPINIIYSELLDKSTPTILKEITSLGDLNSLHESEEKLKWFTDLQKILDHKYSINIGSRALNFDNPTDYVYYLVTSAIANFNQLDQYFDYDVPRWGVGLGDFTHFVSTLFIGEAPDIDKNGRPIVGMLQGSLFRTTDVPGSKGLEKIYDMISITQNSIVKEYTIEMNKIKNETLSYYDKAGRSTLQKDLIGDADKVHQKFVVRGIDGKTAKEMMFVNPYSSDCALNDYEKHYLKFILFELYRYRKANSHLATEVNPAFQNMTQEEAEKQKEFQDMVSNQNSRYFEIPLVHRMGLGTLKNLTTMEFHKVVGQSFNDVKNYLDQRGLTDEQRADYIKHVNKGTLHEMYNQYDMAPEFRQQQIDKYGTGLFEINLDTITLKYTMARMKERKINNLLPNLKAAFVTMQFHAWKTGHTEELQKALNDCITQLQVSVYEESPLQGEESEQVIAWTKKFQHIASIMAISLRPAMLIKEMMVGTLKNISYAWSKVYGDDSFNGNDLKRAYEILMCLGAKGELRNEFNITDAVNLVYRIANMDLNTVVDATKVDRRGMMFFSDKLFWMNTAGDYSNRLSLFIAKMLHDGCWEAHSLDSKGMLVYDPKIDKRFSYYFEKRESYKKDGKYTDSETDKKYNYQRAMYLAVMQELNSERLITGEKQFKESDSIDKAYTNKDRDSIKEFTDTAYGYYDHERFPLIKSLPLGIVFMQFLTFWPAKIKYYFAPPSSGSKRGQIQQKFKINDDGTQQLLFLKTELNEDGEPYTYETTEDTGRPSIGWVGTPVEGLFYSLAYCIRDLKHGLKHVTKDQKNRAMLAVHDILLGQLLMLIASLMLKNYKAQAKEDGDMLSWGQSYTAKIMTNTLQEFDPVQAVFGSVKWTPAFVSILGNSLDSFNKVISGDTTLDKFMRTSFRMLEVFPENQRQ